MNHDDQEYYEVTFTKPDGSHVKKYFIAADSGYQFNRIFMQLRDEIHRLFQQPPLVDAYQVKTRYNQYAA